MNQKPQNSTEIDSENLRRMLEDIYTQLTVPYIKKRATQNSHKPSPVEELQDAISYLTEKERELQLSLDIAKYLLDSNEELQSQISNLKNTQNALCQENSSLAKENNFLERKLQENHIKYDKISENLSKTKGKLERVATNMRKIQENTEKTHTQLVDIEELNEAKFFFDSQTGIYQSEV